METFYRIALSFVEGLGSVNQKLLIEYFGSAKQIFQTSTRDLSMIRGGRPGWVESFKSKKILLEAEKELKLIEVNNISVLTYDAPLYPKKLAYCNDAPALLYRKGITNLNYNRIMSIVGTRESSNYGQTICKNFLNELRAYEPLIVSGLAYGIDQFAHRGAIDNHLPTVAVLGHGLNKIYPAPHKRLSEKILEHGGSILTEYPFYKEVEKHHFPSRNRIIAGMADVTVLVEAAEIGGALITAKLANDYNRDVCAFPGNIYHKQSVGCNNLIKTNQAFPITEARDLKQVMGWEPTNPDYEDMQKPKIPLSADEKKIAQFLTKNGPATMDVILQNMEFSMSELSLILLQMELKDHLMQLPGKVYSIKG